MGDILKLGQFLRRTPKVTVEGYRLVQYGKPCKTKIWHEVSLAIEAAKFRAAESAGASAIIYPNDLLPEFLMDAHTSAVGVERVESCEGSYHYVGIALVTYTLGTYLPQVQMLPETPIVASLRTPSA